MLMCVYTYTCVSYIHMRQGDKENLYIIRDHAREALSHQDTSPGPKLWEVGLHVYVCTCVYVYVCRCLSN